MALAAQGVERKFNICDRCFASVPVSQPFCPECGAPIVTEEHHAEGSDSAVYTELARANLLRMRGEYKQAEDQCLNILKRFPNNSSANTLLGDISAEQGDLTQAVQWYELSLDLLPDEEAVKTKLKSARDRISMQEAATTAKELGLPVSSNKKNLYIAGIVVLVLIVAAASYVFGSRQGGSGKTQNVNPIVKAPSQGGEADGENGGALNKSGDEPLVGSGGELPLMKRLASATPDGAKVLAVLQDPRDKAITVSYLASDTDPRAMGARLARTMLDVESDALKVTVRAMRGGTLIYTADVLRSRVNDTTTQTWLQQNQSDANAWIDYVLMNEWSSAPAKTSDTPAAPSDEDSKRTDVPASKEGDNSPDQTKTDLKAPPEDTGDKSGTPPVKGSSGN